jgi:hypothetical protein
MPTSDSRLKSALLFFLLFTALPLLAQPPQGTGANSGSTPSDQGEVLVDTFDIYYYYADNPNQEIPYSDSTLGNHFRQYDPVRKRSLDYRHLGNLGSAHEPIVFEAVDRRGFEVGFDQFHLYTTTGEELPYYRIEKPLSIVSYTIGSEQADGYITAILSRNFANGLNFSLDYKRINQLGIGSQYPNQNTRNTALASGMSFTSASGRYKSFFSYASNTIEQEDNGGIREVPATDGEFSSPSSATVFLGDARTRHTHREFMYTQYLQFGGGVDSIKGARRAFTIAHQALLNTSNYKYSDDYNAAQDSFFFNQFPGLLTDERGLRLNLQHRELENSFRLATYRLADKRKGPQQQRDLLEVGAIHTLHWLQDLQSDSTLNNLFLNGRYRLNPNERLLIDLRARLGLWDNAGDYRLSGTLFFDFKKLGSLKLEGINQLYAPTLIQHRLNLTAQNAYNNNFDKTLSTTLAGTYELPSFRLKATGKYHLLNNYVYFDTTGLPAQTGIPVSILQLIVEKNFKLGAIHLDNLLAFQESSEDVIRLPNIFSKHSLYYAGYWFQALNVRLGFDLRLNDPFFANYYNPVTGQFQLQDRQEVGFFPALDAFFSLRVTKFRAFVKWENALSILLDDPFYYQTAFYAHPNAAVRIGIKWRFLN